MGLKLEPGKTVIGTVNLEDDEGIIREFTVYYGNALEPIINGILGKMDDADYEKLLGAFLKEEEIDDETIEVAEGGGQYDIPTKAEVRKARIEIRNKYKTILNQMEKERQDKIEERNTNSNEITVGEVEEALQEQDTEVEQPQENEEETNAESVSIDKSLNEKLEEFLIQNEFKNDRRFKTYKILAIVMTAVSLLALGLCGYMYYMMHNTTPEGKTQITINYQVFEVPLANIEVESGNQKLIIYGFTTTNTDGVISQQAIPLGEFDIVDKVLVETKEEEPQEAEETSEEDKDTEEKEGE